MDWGTIVPALIGGIPGLAALVTILISKRQNEATADKTEAEAADVIQGAAIQLLEPLQRRIKELTAEVNALKAEVQETRMENARQHALLIEHGIELGE